MDSDDEREEYTSWKGVPGCIVLINLYDPSSTNIGAIAHVATCRMVRQYLREANSNYIGVCLYGIEYSTSSSSIFGTKNVVDIIPLSAPTLDDFKKLQTTNLSAYTQAGELELSDALWHCSKMFSNCKKQLSSQTIIILTRLDTPPTSSDQKQTLKRVVDLVDRNIDIRVINISQDEYDIDPFYVNFLIEVNKGRDYIIPKPIWDSKEIEKIMHQQSHRHLAVARLAFEIGIGFSIGVGVYNLLKRPGSFFQKKVNLDRESNAILTNVTKTVKTTSDSANTDVGTPMDVDEESNQVPLLKSEIIHYLEYGGERIEFTDNERKSLQNPFGPPMMKLIGFKPASVMCKEKWFLKTGYFLFPNESIIEGSTVAFKAFHQACIETGTVAICVLCTRVNAKSNIVALSATTHPLGLDVEVGFDVIHIPFVENVRDIPATEESDEITEISGEQKTLIKDMLTKIQFDYKPDMFENPKLQSEYRAIEAIALEEEDLDPFVDTTKPDSEKFKSIPEDEFEALFGPFGTMVPKRAATSRETGATAKRLKTENLDDDERSILGSHIEHETVHKYTVLQLKELLKCKQDSSMPALTGLKKAELVDLVYKYYS